MSPETLQHLEFLITIAAIVGAVWRLDARMDSKIAAAVKQLDDRLSNLETGQEELRAEFEERK